MPAKVTEVYAALEVALLVAVYFVRTMSGEPGSLFTLSLKRKPREKRYLRTMSSGLVFLLFMRCMHMCRCCGVSLSGMM